MTTSGCSIARCSLRCRIYINFYCLLSLLQMFMQFFLRRIKEHKEKGSQFIVIFFILYIPASHFSPVLYNLKLVIMGCLFPSLFNNDLTFKEIRTSLSDTFHRTKHKMKKKRYIKKTKNLEISSTSPALTNPNIQF